MTNGTHDQYFTEQEATALKRKLVRAKTNELSVAIGEFSKITMVDKVGIGYDAAGKPVPVWEIGIKWDTDADEEPIYDWFTDKDTFSKHIEIVNKQQRRQGNTFTQEEATALVGKRVRAKNTWNSGLLKKGAVGTITGVSKLTNSIGEVTWKVEITWDTTTDRYLPQFPPSRFFRDIEVLVTCPCCEIHSNGENRTGR